MADEEEAETQLVTSTVTDEADSPGWELWLEGVRPGLGAWAGELELYGMEVSDLDSLDKEDLESFSKFLQGTSMKPFHKLVVLKAVRKLSSPEVDLPPKGLPMLNDQKLTPILGR